MQLPTCHPSSSCNIICSMTVQIVHKYRVIMCQALGPGCWEPKSFKLGTAGLQYWKMGQLKCEGTIAKLIFQNQRLILRKRLIEPIASEFNVCCLDNKQCHRFRQKHQREASSKHTSGTQIVKADALYIILFPAPRPWNKMQDVQYIYFFCRLFRVQVATNFKVCEGQCG